jgi:hypothetical protein
MRMSVEERVARARLLCGRLQSIRVESSSGEERDKREGKGNERWQGNERVTCHALIDAIAVIPRQELKKSDDCDRLLMSGSVS